MTTPLRWFDKNEESSLRDKKIRAFLCYGRPNRFLAQNHLVKRIGALGFRLPPANGQSLRLTWLHRI